ncbi:MAG: hypothetical protein KQI35_08055 [Bacteroidetes bacterium]|nr:hypothetical protein [Bacteroidota bacterium]
MKSLLIILFIPMLAFSQQPNEFWITPVANIEFGEERIIYSYSLDECNPFINLHPVHYSEKVMEINGVFGTGCIDDYQDMLNQLSAYIEEWNYNAASNKDKYNYLKAVCLLTIWDYPGKNILSANTLEILGYLEDDLSVEIAKATQQTVKLYHFYHKDKNTP